MPTFGEVLKLAREAANLTQQQIAAKAGLSQSAISKAELSATALDAGRKETVERIAVAAGTTIEAILRTMEAGEAVGAEQVAKAISEHEMEHTKDLDDEPPLRVPTPQQEKEAVAREIEREMEVIRQEKLGKGYWYTSKYSNERIVAYFGDVLGRNFDYRVHRVTDTHEALRLLHEFLEGHHASLTLFDHYSTEMDHGVRVLLDSIALLRKRGRPRHVANVVLAMIVVAGRGVSSALKSPGSVSIPDIVIDHSEYVCDSDDIPF